MENHPSQSEKFVQATSVAKREMTREEYVYKKKPNTLGQALSQFISSRGLASSMQNQQLTDVWKEVAGERIAAGTKIGTLKNGTLSVFVGNSALLGELVSFHQQSLLKGLQKSYSQQQIKQLKFRLKNSAGN